MLRKISICTYVYTTATAQRRHCHIIIITKARPSYILYRYNVYREERGEKKGRSARTIGFNSTFSDDGSSNSQFG